jgi:N-acetylglucosaminyldiphosphoundecaprenol N-acetyl-beta-D-mannosaminyltransferase
MGFADQRSTAPVLGASIDALSWDEALDRIATWARNRESRYVCACNVHSVVTASLDATFRDAVNRSDMATPDGMPVAWALRRLGFPRQVRINGPDLMWRLLDCAVSTNRSVFFYGNSPETLRQLEMRIRAEFPRVQIAGMLSPPFRPLTEAEDGEIVATINRSGAELVFVSLGCPKQELWMAEHRGRIQAVMLGVGAAFDYHAGTLERAPLWMQHAGLEWAYRLAKEPRRLSRRYLTTNTIFAVRIAWQLVTGRQGPYRR